MTNFKNQIITASAGTGKTYRLSLEYIALILRYYEIADFSLDSILALTFTRKATFEIRERILEHLEKLDKGAEKDLEENLCKMLGREDKELNIRDRGIITSARRQILNDSRYLQVSTIDSYIGKIFRNIVCPLRNIDEYSIDENAINKRMPFLLEHLMQPAILKRIDNLLSRKVLRGLDDYSGFFSSLIKERWLYYLIRKRTKENNLAIPAKDHLQLFDNDIAAFCQGIGNSALIKQIPAFEVFKKGMKDILKGEPNGGEDLYRELMELVAKPLDAVKLMKELASGQSYMQKHVDKDLRPVLSEYQLRAAEHLANYLFEQLFIPEQEEILELWEIILKEYDKLIYRYKNMTYDDVSWYSFEALFAGDPPRFDFSMENTANEFYYFLSHRTRFLLIDEFQDTSLIQFNILKPIMEEICAGYGSKDFGGMIVVGDEKQSIFGWRKGERELLLNLRYLVGSLQDVKEDKLDTSYRSTEGMMDFINTIFLDEDLHSHLAANHMNWSYLPVKSGIGKLPGTLEFKCAQYSSSEGVALSRKEDAFEDFVVNMVKPAWEADSEQRFAIICRKNDELSILQTLLEKHGMGGLFQPSDYIVNHRLIHPLISWLRFVCYNDYYELLSFLRSDYLMLNTGALKYLVDALAQHNSDLENKHYDAALDLSAYPALAEWFNLAERQGQMSPYQCLRDILGLVLNEDLQKSKRDRLNLEAFLAMVRDWELNQAAQGAHLPDLLDYIEENSAQENWKQVSVEGEEKLELITIHSAKGLQFDRVFVFMSLSSRGGRDSANKLFWTYRYAQIPDKDGKLVSNLQYLDAYALSYHYQDILKQSSARELWEASERQALLEELNNIYVAITRAKTSLHLYFCFESKDEWPKYFAAKQSEDKSKNLLPLLIANSCQKYFADIEESTTGIRSIALHPDSEKKEDDEAKGIVVEELSLGSASLASAKGLDWQRTRPLEENLHQNWQAVFIERPQHLYGDILHYYLSFILRDTEDEHRLALKHCLKRYGSLLPESKIRELCESGRRKLQEYSYLFAAEYDKVYTELPVKKYRIDRLLVNTAKKEVLIIDYKTGRIHEPEQLEKYKAALEELPAFQGYRYKLEYIPLQVSV